MTPIYVLLFVIGLVVGSFLNVVILRTISEESIVFPGSKCPNCQTPLKWYHNIPVLSYIFLRGKCAFCKAHISIQYPIVELLTGIIFAILGYLYLTNMFNAKFSTPVLIIMYTFAVISSSLLIVISGTDIKEMKVSDYHTYSLAGMSILYSTIIGCISFFPDLKFGIVNWNDLYNPLLFTLFGIVVAFFLMEIIRRSLNFLLKTETFGDGDSYIYAGVAGFIVSIFGFTNISNILISLLVILFASVCFSVIFSFPAYVKQLIANKKWMILSFLSAFILYALIYFNYGTSLFINNTITLIITTSLLIILGAILCFLVISSIKDNHNSTSQIPFGPALCFSGFLGLVILPYMLGII